MDYKKEYDEMVQRVKELHKAGNTLTKKQMEIICPELAESEDERIREELIGALMWQRDCLDAKGPHDNNLILPGFTMKVGDILAWLEKQKEQKHPDGCFTCNEYKKGYEEGRRNGFTAGYNKAMKEIEQKEQKPVVTHGETYRVDTLGTQQVIAGKMPQKPAEWSEDIIQKAVKEIGLTQHQIDWFKTNVFPPKQEWSEEDDEMVEEIKHIVFGAGSVKNGMREKRHNWLYNRLKYHGEVYINERYLTQTIGNILRWADEHPKEQKPVEWNDTDMKEARDNLVSVCRDWELGKQTTLLPIVAVRARYFLEHLTEPKPAEWSDEDERMRNQLIYDIEHHKKDGLISAKQNKATKALYNGIEKCYDEKIAWLKSLRPVSKESLQSWKPSGEQMEALERASTNKYISAKQFDILVSLYEQLKKLI